ncbi:MAG: hypothetical protein MPJ05_07920 [Nitrosopumilus sp.]|nr:hypothetical protein [Nitrosopumilus sp.]
MAVHTVRATGQGPGRLRREIAQYMDRDGFVAFSAGKYSILGTGTPAGGLVPCPACGAGQLRVVRSPGTGKRFMGCTNFYGGCTASSPLYQRARLRGTKTPCASCGWPEVIYRYARTQKWSRKCSNISCPRSAGAGTPAGSGAARRTRSKPGSKGTPAGSRGRGTRSRTGSKGASGRSRMVRGAGSRTGSKAASRSASGSRGRTGTRPRTVRKARPKSGTRSGPAPRTGRRRAASRRAAAGTA